MSRTHGLTLIKEVPLFTEAVELALYAGGKTSGECTFVIDELKRVYSSPSGAYWHYITPETRNAMFKLFTEGGNFGLSVVWNDQRAAHVNPPALSESTCHVLGRLKHPRDIQTIRQFWTIQPAENKYLFNCELENGETLSIRTF